ncbi:phytanoyl-CoA dioxygenase family protein [Hyphomonas chukchiensis]|uniref:Phytanoyl-CoA dioxygenase n=1 Tax=Hyphomonas chukchiensis TaxID=1280947 RepID=A0A062USZ6_9PROT|nr:phytanoyl-CoA dioxygenase family protein [Hyphomonas chukchiensis]KCZ60922.1 hypothetical protein HY30_00890 [Hyphomonas chukchiensis]
MTDGVEAFEETGRFWVRDALSEAELALLDEACRVEARPGVRLKWSDALRVVLGPDSSIGRLCETLQAGAKPVRLVAFDKSADANWGVPWHQDRVIAVRERQDLEGYGAWVKKDGFWHCEPPINILQSMFFVRVHLDAADNSNGCLELAQGMHTLGRIASDRAGEIATSAPVEMCHARRGDLLFVKALMLHRSSSSTTSGEHRRALRIDYSSEQLPSRLEWVSH